MESEHDGWIDFIVKSITKFIDFQPRRIDLKQNIDSIVLQNYVFCYKKK